MNGLLPGGATVVICASVVLAAVVAYLLLRARAPIVPDSGTRLRERIDSDMAMLEEVWRITQREIILGHPHPSEVRRQALAFSSNLDAGLGLIEEYFRAAVADLPAPKDGIAAALADEGESLRFALLVRATRGLVRALDTCDDVDAGVARLRAAVDRVLEGADAALWVQERADFERRA